MSMSPPKYPSASFSGSLARTRSARARGRRKTSTNGGADTSAAGAATLNAGPLHRRAATGTGTRRKTRRRSFCAPATVRSSSDPSAFAEASAGAVAPVGLRGPDTVELPMREPLLLQRSAPGPVNITRLAVRWNRWRAANRSAGPASRAGARRGISRRRTPAAIPRTPQGRRDAPRRRSDDARNLHAKHRAPVPARLHLDAPAVRLDDLVDDEKPEAEAVLTHTVHLGTIGAMERVEQVLPHAGRDHAVVLDREGHFLELCAIDVHLYRCAALAVLEGVADEVGGDLGDALGIPPARQITREMGLDAPPGSGAAMLLEHALDEGAKVGLLRLHHDTAAEARAGQIEHVLDEPPHAPPAGEDAVGRLPILLVA